MKINWKVVIALGLIVWVIGSSQTILVTVVVVSGALFYISHTAEHRWIRRFRRVDTSILDTQPIAVVSGTDRKGRARRSQDYSGQDR